MLKRLPSRNQRSKGIRAKHALQICLLIGVCFWLIYQVKHSHDKKKEFDENDAKTSIRRVSDSEIPKLGRKDLHPREEEEEEETPVEEEQHKVEREEEGDKNDSQEQEEEENKNEEAEENKNEEAEDNGRGGGDDEIDENEQETKDDEENHNEEFIDEEKEREEESGDESKTNDNEENEDRLENENSSEDQDNDGGDQNDHEAREEHYIRDDASSEVAHDTDVISTRSEKISSENSNENTERNNFEQEDNSINTQNVNKIESNSGSTVGEGKTAENHTSLGVVSLAQKVDGTNSSNSADSQVSVTTQSNDQPEAGNNPVQVSTEANNSSAAVSTEATNHPTMSTDVINSSTETRSEISDSSEQKKAETGNEASDSSQKNDREPASNSDHAHTKTLDGPSTRESKREEISSLKQTDNSTIGSEDNKVDFNSTDATKTENADEASKELSESSKNPETDVSGKILRPDERDQVEDVTTPSTTKENTGAIQNEKSDSKSDSNGTEGGSDSAGGIEEAVQHDPIDSLDTQITQELNEVRTDLDTLPDMESQGIENEEEVAAER
ncbi:hypothetical protein PanWU01x14_190860 [Parasponia andersonii]|uniref:Transmembrane protein n=1 Tax=Parasponia andersonii TaxID=3476 RepID=A0A2P5C258_PARAD|nr:hypothetical protein PanWU01x14_190860 [Parasponia andersonii]